MWCVEQFSGYSCSRTFGVFAGASVVWTWNKIKVLSVVSVPPKKTESALQQEGNGFETYAHIHFSVSSFSNESLLILKTWASGSISLTDTPVARPQLRNASNN